MAKEYCTPIQDVRQLPWPLFVKLLTSYAKRVEREQNEIKKSQRESRMQESWSRHRSVKG